MLLNGSSHMLIGGSLILITIPLKKIEKHSGGGLLQFRALRLSCIGCCRDSLESEKAMPVQPLRAGRGADFSSHTPPGSRAAAVGKLEAQLHPCRLGRNRFCAEEQSLMS